MQDIHEIIVEVIEDEAAEYRKEAERYKELYENEQEKVRHLEYQIRLLKMKIQDISSLLERRI